MNYTTDNAISLIDGVNIRSLHAFIENASGFLDEPERKEPYKYSWPDEHGLDIDTQNIYYNERKCSIDLIVNGTDYANLVTNINAIKAIFRRSLLRYLKLYGIPGVFLVRVNGVMTVTRLGRGLSGRQLARLSIPLMDPYPVKLQYYTNYQTCGLQITTSKPVTVDWGDNTFSSLQASGTLLHSYNEYGEYCISIYGSVQGITSVGGNNCQGIDTVIGGGIVDPGETNITSDSTSVTVDDTSITADKQ